MFSLAMEHVDGPNVRELMRRNPRGVDPRCAADIILQVLDAVIHAHDRSFIHRDIKSSNVLLGRDRHGSLIAKISDFGLARSYETLGASGFTRASDVPSLAPHLPPERILDFCNVTPLADIYSTGAVLYHLVTGEHAFDFQARRDPLATILEDDIVPVFKRSPQVPHAVAVVIERAMRKDPARRFHSAGEMRQALYIAMYREGVQSA
jgi:serine/threonine-protein kinase